MSDGKAGGLSTATLNHLVSPSALKEYVDLVLEEEQLVEKAKVVARDRAIHELELRIAGVSREQLQQAVLEALVRQ